MAQSKPSMPLQLWSSYVRSLETRPLRTKALTSAFMLTVQEAIVQAIRRRPDVLRALKLAAYGFAISGPMGHVLYTGIANATAGLPGALNALAQLLLVNGVVIPIQIAVYLAALAVISGERNLASVVRSVRGSLMPILVGTWRVFPLVQIFATVALPEPLRLPFYNLLGLVHGVMTTLTASKAEEKQRDVRVVAAPAAARPAARPRRDSSSDSDSSDTSQPSVVVVSPSASPDVAPRA